MDKKRERQTGIALGILGMILIIPSVYFITYRIKINTCCPGGPSIYEYPYVEYGIILLAFAVAMIMFGGILYYKNLDR
jgi:hypothetical protein